MTDEHLDRPERRNFLKGVALTGGTLALSGLATGVARAREEGTAEDRQNPKSGGYRLTPHVLDYYRTLRF